MHDKVSQATLALAKAYTDSHGGGGGGTSDYNDLSHLPTLNGVTLKGTMTSSEVGLGDLADKDEAEGTYTPEGSVSVAQGTDSTTSVGSMTGVGILPSLSVEGTKLTFNAGALPSKENVTVVTASGERSATFSGTQATIEVS